MSPVGARDVPLVGGAGHELEVPKCAVYMVYITVIMDTIGSSISTPVMPYYAQSFGVGAAGVGYLFGAWSLTAAIFPPILGRLADKIGRKPVLVMSLFGAGVAALAQGLAPNYYALLAARAFSGVWGAVGSTAQVYITDVAPEPIRAHYLTMVSSLPMIGVVFGPGIGGLLSKVGLNFPILLDGLITIGTGVIVAFLLKETPAFLRTRTEATLAQGAGEAADGAAPASHIAQATRRLPRKMHYLGFSTFFFGVVFGTIVSMYAFFMQARFKLGATEVGFIFMGLGVLMLATNVILVKPAQKRLGLYRTAQVATQLAGVFMILMAFTWSLGLSIACFLLAAMANSIRMATNPSIVAEITETSTRGYIFGWIQRYNNFGRCLGPILMGYLAERLEELPWLSAAGASTLSVVILLMAECIRQEAPAQPGQNLSLPDAENNSVTEADKPQPTGSS